MVIKVNQKSRYICRTLVGIQNSLNLLTGSYDPSDFDVNTTLNSLYNISANLVPQKAPTLKCFMIGIGGVTNVNSDNLADRNYVFQDNLGLYIPLAFRTVPIEEDLSSEEKVNYRLRYVYEDHKGNRMVKYYAKVIDNLSSKTMMTRPSDNGEYKIDYSKLTPTPVDPTINGIEEVIENEVTVYKDLVLPVLGSEVLETVGVDYSGDLRYARVSEIGLISGEDKVVTINDVSGNAVQMTELVGAQLSVHRTFGGVSFETADSIFTDEYRITSDDFVV